ncbi:MAG: thioredoxin-like domain-containing protein [Chitinophagaceae bacterium]
MKRLSSLFALFLTCSAFSQDGYEIKVTFKPFTNKYVYLGHYFGKSYPIIDSALLNEKSEAVFRGSKKLNGGIYLVGYPNKTGFFEILVDKEQHFSVMADTATLSSGARFSNSPDNDLFISYQQQMNSRGREIGKIREKIKSASSKDSAKLVKDLAELDKEIRKFREELIEKNPNSLLSVLLVAMREPELTGRLKEPLNREDSLDAYYYYKNHYWDGVNFWDGRLAYTTFFDEKLEKYFNQVVTPNPDSVIREIDYMLGFGSLSEEMTRFLLVKFANRYLNQKYMWEDAVFVHLFEKYFASKSYPWLSESGRKTITDRAYSLMANIMGNMAPDVVLPDTAGKYSGLYDLAADYVVVVFWDPTCGHCKEVLPRLDSFYREKWKPAGLRMFAVAKEVEGTKADWMNFIREKDLGDWTHVYYSKAEDKTRISSGTPGYSQLYDVQSFPTLYLLDKEKRIIAKKLAVDQIDDVLQVKRNNQ